MLYSIGEAARMLGVSASALRYYDREGLLPHVGRTDGGTRLFTEDDLEWFHFIERLKRSGMPIREIKRYVELYLAGDATLEERRELVRARRDAVERELEELRDTLDFITYKCWFYDTAIEAGTADAARSLPPEQMPPEIRAIKERCGIRVY